MRLRSRALYSPFAAGSSIYILSYSSSSAVVYVASGRDRTVNVALSFPVVPNYLTVFITSLSFAIHRAERLG